MKKEGQPNLYRTAAAGEAEPKVYTPTQSKESPPTSLEKVVMSRRPVVEPSDDEEDFPEQDWETEGSGFASADELIHRFS